MRSGSLAEKRGRPRRRQPRAKTIEPRAKLAAALEWSSSPRRILVVEDEYLIACLIHDQLAELGYGVVGPALKMGQARRLAMSEYIWPEVRVIARCDGETERYRRDSDRHRTAARHRSEHAEHDREGPTGGDGNPARPLRFRAFEQDIGHDTVAKKNEDRGPHKFAKESCAHCFFLSVDPGLCGRIEPVEGPLDGLFPIAILFVTLRGIQVRIPRMVHSPLGAQISRSS